MPTYLECPKCGYDLDAAPGETGTCPECGAAFARADITDRRHVVSIQGLGLLAFGAFGLILAEALARCIGYFPRAGDGTAGNARSAAEWLRLIPVTVIAGGLVALASITPASRRIRIASFGIAAAYWIVVIHDAYSASPAGRYPGSWWLQPQTWNWSSFVAPLLALATMVACLMQVAAVSRAAGLSIFERLARFGLIIAAAALCTTVLHMIIRQFEGFPAPGVPIGPTGRPVQPVQPRQPTFLESGGAGRALMYIDGMLRTALWLGIGVLAFAARRALSWKRA